MVLFQRFVTIVDCIDSLIVSVSIPIVASFVKNKMSSFLCLTSAIHYMLWPICDIVLCRHNATTVQGAKSVQTAEATTGSGTWNTPKARPIEQSTRFQGRRYWKVFTATVQNSLPA